MKKKAILILEGDVCEVQKVQSIGLGEFLKRSSIFFGVDVDELEKLARAGVPLRFEKGEEILREGEVLSSFFVIKEGVVKIFKSSLSGRVFTIDVRYSSETFAELATIAGVPCFASVQAVEDTIIVAINRGDFLAFINRNPFVAMRILQVEGERIKNLYNKLINLVTDTAGQRLIKVLCTLSSKYGNTLRFTHQEIAEMSGSTLETSTRVITQLKNAGILSSERGKLIIRNQNKLRTLENSSPSI